MGTGALLLAILFQAAQCMSLRRNCTTWLYARTFHITPLGHARWNSWQHATFEITSRTHSYR